MSRSRTRRIAKWMGVGMCVLLLAAAVASYWWEAQWGKGQHSVSLGAGTVLLVRTHEVDVRSFPSRWNGVRRTNPADRVYLWWFVGGRNRGDLRLYLFIPLWAPLLAIAIPTAWLWWRDRRHPPGHCRKCGYDLTGNVTGVCGECGTVLRPQSQTD